MLSETDEGKMTFKVHKRSYEQRAARYLASAVGLKVPLLLVLRLLSAVQIGCSDTICGPVKSRFDFNERFHCTDGKEN